MPWTALCKKYRKNKEAKWIMMGIIIKTTWLTSLSISLSSLSRWALMIRGRLSKLKMWTIHLFRNLNPACTLSTLLKTKLTNWFQRKLFYNQTVLRQICSLLIPISRVKAARHTSKWYLQPWRPWTKTGVRSKKLLTKLKIIWTCLWRDSLRYHPSSAKHLARALKLSVVHINYLLSTRAQRIKLLFKLINQLASIIWWFKRLGDSLTRKGR